ncbi:MAG: DUF262 domain-containing protein, partial [Clostridium sp.]
MIQIDNIDTSLRSLLEEKKSYEIPLNQRIYSWEENQIIDFWNDLDRVKNNGNNHFMGVVTFINNDLTIKVVDG